MIATVLWQELFWGWDVGVQDSSSFERRGPKFFLREGVEEGLPLLGSCSPLQSVFADARGLEENPGAAALGSFPRFALVKCVSSEIDNPESIPTCTRK